VEENAAFIFRVLMHPPEPVSITLKVGATRYFEKAEKHIAVDGVTFKKNFMCLSE
jgi:hypothetical protein